MVDLDDFLDNGTSDTIEPVNVDGLIDKVVLSDEQEQTLIPVNIRGTTHLENVEGKEI